MDRPGPLGPRHGSLQQLRRLSRRPAVRAESGRFVIDGPVLLAEALDAGVAVRDVFVEPAGEDLPVVARAATRGATVHRLRAGTLARVTDTVTPQPVAATADQPVTRLDDALPAATGGFTLVLVGVSDPGNAGTLVRVAEAAGARAVLFCGGSVDPYNPKCVRSSAGALFHVRVVSGGEAEDVLERLEAAGVRTVGTVSRDGDAYDRVDLTGSLALVLGNEAHGLAPSVRERLQISVTIPMAGRSESLNVAMAGSVIAFESLRQRREAAERASGNDGVGVG